MSAVTSIAWTHSTFNPWIGCTKIGPGCDGCYAAAFAPRLGVKFGSGETRKLQKDAYWEHPRAWDRAAKRKGERRRVFVASMADVFDNEAPEGLRERLFKLIEETPNLDWLALTKRIGNAAKMLPAAWLADSLPRNLWLGITIVNQEELERDVPKLRAIPAVVRFISFEPLISSIDARGRVSGIHWGIIGGESGHKARPFWLGWMYRLMRDLKAEGVSVFNKQLGAKAFDGALRFPTKDKKGGEMVEWPEALRVREFPAVAS